MGVIPASSHVRVVRVRASRISPGVDTLLGVLRITLLLLRITLRETLLLLLLRSSRGRGRWNHVRIVRRRLPASWVVHRGRGRRVRIRSVPSVRAVVMMAVVVMAIVRREAQSHDGGALFLTLCSLFSFPPEVASSRGGG